MAQIFRVKHRTLPKIMLTGKNGQVGWELQRTLAPLGQVLALGRQDLDLADLGQISAGGHRSWYGFSKAIVKYASHIVHNSIRLNPIPTNEYPTLARRPKYSVLSKLNLKKL